MRIAGEGIATGLHIFAAETEALAALRGRKFVLPDDVKRVAGPVLTHRVILKPESRLRKVTAEHVVSEVVAEIAVPTLSS